jgi:hypothetical protein
MEIKLTPTESEMYFHNALCNSLNYIYGYGLRLDYDEQDYKDAKVKLNNPCFEDVLMQILKDGKTITMEDIEGEGEYTSTITIQDVHDKVQKTPLYHLSRMIHEDDDSETGDAILQIVFFSDIIFG